MARRVFASAVCIEAGDLVRFVARRRVRGHREGRRHHVLSAGAGRRVRRLGEVLLLAQQRGGRQRARACAQWYVTCYSIT